MFIQFRNQMKVGEILEEFVKGLLTNPEQISFAVLFVSLLFWVMKQNNDREQNYQKTIDKLADSLKDVESIKTTVEKINEKLN
ncbi:hypothetical protein HMPREF9511_00831 [Enterococcus faecalis TX0630]|uniref:Bacteriocin UviB n=2 Tax=Enterococcus TaxID=1350 RepID=A0ABC9P7Z1_ENTFL|nr:hypothetical protein HMPREF9505_00109 [Enterococcus faecalis TX0109]EFU07698.1 hypothetical protein HMPREF9516_02736 [Enterococcus faecalis TX1302]EFU91111.1 hypothetical protein HMPREF9511_00831 [Enterococcus faecalis TX0630]